MGRSLILILAVAGIGGCAAPSPTCLSADAHGIVTALQPDEQFRAMLKAAASRTQTVAMASARDGGSADDKLSEAIDRAVERHSAEWKDNLVSSWSSLSPAELDRVCTAINQRDQETFRIFAERLGPQVQTRNEPLLNRAGAEVLEDVWSPGSTR